MPISSIGSVTDDERRAAQIRAAQAYIQQQNTTTNPGVANNPSDPNATGIASLSVTAHAALGTAPASSTTTSALTADPTTSLDTSAAPLGNVGQFIQDNLTSVTEDMVKFAQDQKTRNTRKKQVDKDIATLEDTLNDWPKKADGSDKEKADVEVFVWNPDKKTYEEKNLNLTKEEAQDLKNELGSEKSELQNMREMDMLELQRMTQQYQLMISIYTNILRMNYDIGKNIAGNIHQ
jgi:hypothetical protein